ILDTGKGVLRVFSSDFPLLGAPPIPVLCSIILISVFPLLEAEVALIAAQPMTGAAQPMMGTAQPMTGVAQPSTPLQPCEHWLAVVVWGATGPQPRVRLTQGQLLAANNAPATYNNSAPLTAAVSNCSQGG
ncbi:hypothetical protein L208DRAFT_1292623, partial [Tricholoma matsutake]